MTATPVQAVVSLSGARAAYVGPGLALSPHRNATATLAVALEAPFELAIAAPAGSARSLAAGASFAARASTTTGVALIPPRTLHHLRTHGPMAFIYLDALGDDHASLAAMNLAAARERLLAGGSDSIAALDVDALCDALGVPRRASADPRISRVVRCLDAQPDAFDRVTAAACVAGLSASRFQALFRQAVGVPFRRYRLWRRMALVAQAISDGRTLTHAAHEAGFASSAHLSAAFREMFGLVPSALVAGSVLIRASRPSRLHP